jgi:aspartate carbamoyltransferase regulatory subunit
MMPKPEELIVRRIKDGTVIDHIPAGQALNVLRILGVRGGEGYTVATVMNVESSKLGRKDIVKLENRELALDEVNKIALVAPEATINTIRDYRVVKKTKVKLPDEIEGIIKCVNPNCISNQVREPVVPRFVVISRNPALLGCKYCGAYITQRDLIIQFASATI